MTPDRLRRIEQLYHSALELEPADRSGFLDDACRGDAALRSEVAALLLRERSAEEMFGAAAFDVAAREMARESAASFAGRRMGVYEIGALLGAGGMGHVYRARDTRLGRDVAIKVLAPIFQSDPQRIARFEREARVLAALSHPHIATLFGLEDVDGFHALVLELVEGPTLAEVIGQRNGAGLPIDECLRIARQLRDALDAAHQVGIVHRDLKPANIKLTAAGDIKVLDFGLARASDEGRPWEQGDALTAEGTVLGTPAYMSPEQTRGKPVDRRTDIWAFGCVVFEMLTGRAAFGRDTTSDVIAAVLGVEPDWNALPAATPAGLERLLRRCLEKSPNARLRDIGDASLEDEPALRTDEERGVVAPPRAIRARVLGITLLIALAAVALTALSFLRNRDDPTAPDVLEFGLGLPPDHTPWSGVAVSPDGRRVAIGTFGPGPMIWVHSFGSGERKQVAGSDGAAAPFWSPDGASLGYFARGSLWRTDLATGSPVKVCPTFGWLGASWGAGDVIVFSSDNALFSVPAAGGTPSKIAMPESGPVVRSHPRFLPDGRRFIYYEQSAGGGQVFAGVIDGSLRKPLVDSTEAAVFAPPGFLLFVRGTSLLVQRLDLEAMALVGQPSVVAADVAPGFLSGRAAFSASETVLAFARSREGRPGELAWFDDAGRRVGAIAQPAGVEHLNPAISPDGTRIAVNRMDPHTGNWDIWIIDAERGVQTRVTFHEASDSDPIWSPDGKQILFASNRGGRAGLYTKSADGTGAETALFQSDRPGAAVVPSDWSRRGTLVFSHSNFPPAGWALSMLELSSGQPPIPLSDRSRFAAYAGRVSPDGQWLAYASSETGMFEVYVRPVSGPGPKVQVSHGGGTHPRWIADGGRLVYWAQPGGLMSVDIEVQPGALRPGAPELVIPTRVLELIDGRPHYDVTRDGRRYLLRQPASDAEPPIGVIVNWMRKLSSISLVKPVGTPT